jgi:hypothetical protein
MLIKNNKKLLYIQSKDKISLGKGKAIPVTGREGP